MFAKKLTRTNTDARNTASTSKRAIRAACIGNAPEWYDFAIYGALATVVGLTFFPSKDLATALTAAFAVYGTALIVRPLGALAFGRLADTRGRRTVLISVVLLMAGATALVGVLPGYATIGLLAPILLVVLRAAQGLAVGGELGVAAVFILESAESRRRGQAGSWHTATMALGIAVGMGVGGLLALLGDEDGRGAPWRRLAFLLALPLGLVGLYLRRQVAETSQFVALRASSALVHAPVRLLWRSHRVSVLRAFALVSAGSLAFNTFFIFMPNNLVARHGASLSWALLVTAGALMTTGAAALALGRLSDRVGRRAVTLGSSAALAILAIPAATLATRGSLLGLGVAQALLGVTVAGVLSVAMIAEAFPATVRATGVAMTAGIATALVGGTAPLISQILVATTAQEVLPGVYVTAVAGLALVALRRWPETAFQDLDWSSSPTSRAPKSADELGMRQRPGRGS